MTENTPPIIVFAEDDPTLTLAKLYGDDHQVEHTVWLKGPPPGRFDYNGYTWVEQGAHAAQQPMLTYSYVKVAQIL